MDEMQKQIRRLQRFLQAVWLLRKRFGVNEMDVEERLQLRKELFAIGVDVDTVNHITDRPYRVTVEDDE